MLLLLHIFLSSVALNKISGCCTCCSTSVLKPPITVCNVSALKSAMFGEIKLPVAVVLQFTEFQYKWLSRNVVVLQKQRTKDISKLTTVFALCCVQFCRFFREVLSHTDPKIIKQNNLLLW